MTHEATEPAPLGPNRLTRIAKATWWLSMLVILILLLMLVRLLPVGPAIEMLRGWIAGLGFWGPGALVLLYIVATVLLVPGMILTLVAGAMFGLVIGTIAISIGSTLGAAVTFLIARYLARERIAVWAARNRNFSTIEGAIEEGGWKIVAMLRLSPAIPFNLQNYLYGLTPIRFWPCIVASWVAMLPGTFTYVYIGHMTGAAVGGDRVRTPAEWGVMGIGLLATVAGTVYITLLVRKKLREKMQETL